MPVSGLDENCGACGRRRGSHTLDELVTCMGEVTTDVEYEDTPADSVAAGLRERFGLDPDLIVANHVQVRALTLQCEAMGAAFRLPLVEHTFQIGIAGRPPAPVAKVAYLGDVAAVRKYGQLIRDSANGAARAAER